ncbi:MAG: hypothetical protein V7606_742, partial [Burkholderiales bacterium]
MVNYVILNEAMKNYKYRWLCAHSR